MGLAKWDKAESALQRILRGEPKHQVALYQLSQVYLERNLTEAALRAIRLAKNECQNKNEEPPNDDEESVVVKRPNLGASGCLFGGKCIPRTQLCKRILVQEADILREMKDYKLAAKVS